MYLLKNILLTAVTVLSFTFNDGTCSSPEKSNEEVGEFFDSEIMQMLNIIRSSTDEIMLNNKLKVSLDSSVDHNTACKLIIGGKIWRQFDDEIKVSFLKECKNNLILDNIPRLKKYKDHEINILSIEIGSKDSKGNFIHYVNTEMSSKNSNEPLKVQYMLTENSNGEIKMLDLRFAEISVNMLYKEEYYNLFALNTYEQAINKLREHNLNAMKTLGISE